MTGSTSPIEQPKLPPVASSRSDNSLPIDWNYCELKDLIDPQAPICYGILMPGSHHPDGVPVIKVRDYEHDELSNQHLLLTDPRIEQAYARSRLSGGDILLAIRGTTGAVAKVPKSLSGANITQDSARIRVRGEISREYVYQALQSPSVQREIQLHTVGQAVKGINIAQVRRLRIPLPVRREQGVIAAVLTAWDRVIYCITQLLKAKRRLKRGLMQQLLTGTRRFAEFTNEEWCEYRLGDLFAEREEIGRGDLPLLSITADRGIIPRTEIDRKDSSNEDKSLYRRIAPGDIGYNTMRMWQGVSALSQLEGVVSPAYTVCIPSTHIHAPFAVHLFKFTPVVHLFRRYSQGLVDDTLSLKFHHFAQIKVALPPLQEQNRISEVLSAVDCEIDTLTAQLALLKSQKRGLMQQLLTGRIRVSTASGGDHSVDATKMVDAGSQSA